ncbi:MAG: phosphoribosylamine--glycine ligase [Burkholderiales bacterium]|nr:phosphoribosylamine--glycine ligase [Burkholderiales bacterium]
MKILVIGSGGREHALAWKLAQSPKVTKVYVAPGNAGTADEEKMENLPLTDMEELAEFAKKHDVDFTLVGPEAPLAAGVVNLFRSKGLQIFGPTKEGAQLESSKDFAKSFMKRHGIPTAEYQTFTDVDAAHQYIKEKGAPIVIKADGLAAGKGVVVAMTEPEAHQAVDFMLAENKFGSAGSKVVIEEFLDGEEASFIVMADGKNVLPMATSQDHKRLLDEDKGPNTGGMGAYSPAPVVTKEIYDKVMNEIILPTVKGMEEEGIPFSGFLYAGLMIGKDKEGKPTVKTLEFNCRFGDPETQPIMSRLKSDFADLINAGISGNLDKVTAEWDERPALGVVLAAEGYPTSPRKGDEISGIPESDDSSKTFHAGTKKTADGKTVTSGGRVLCVVGLGETLQEARDKAYEQANKIHFNGCQKREDIGHRALEK